MIRNYLFAFFMTLISLSAADDGPDHTPTVTVERASHQRVQRDWSDDIIYFILIDRFYNGDPTNDNGSNPNSHIPYREQRHNQNALKTYQGGDLQGVIDKLPYLDSLGVTTIWLSPVFDNPDTDFGGWWPYHGYHPVDFFRVDEHFGSMALLRELIDRAHQRGINVILDMIYNHVAPNHPWVMDSSRWYDEGYKHWFHPHSGVDASTSIQDWQDQHQLECREMSGLPDLAQENPTVYKFLLDVSKFWIEETNCDGFRLDAVKHIPPDFWKRLCADIHDFAGSGFLLLGEVFSGDSEYVRRYQSLGFDALFDIPMYYTINRVFAQGASVHLLSEQVAQNKLFDSTLVSSLIDNHDVARFGYHAQTCIKPKLKAALVFAMCLNGLPMLYYGTEVALPGAAPENEDTGEGQDYLNRLPMTWDDVTGANADLVRHIRSLNNIRRTHPALRIGEFIEIYKDYGIYAFLKVCSNDAVLCILNTSSTLELRSINLRDLILDATVTDFISGETLSISQDSLNIELPPFGVYLLDISSHIIRDQMHALNWHVNFTKRLPNDMQKIRFRYQPATPVQSVSVAGDFNGWDAEANPLQFDDTTNEWAGTIALRAGRYRYKLVIDGHNWIADPNAVDYELDPFGGNNSVLVVE